MTCISLSDYKTSADGSRVVRAFLLADELPATLPETGSGIIGMDEGMTFAPASVLYTTDANAEHKVYIVNEAGEWTGVDGGVMITM